MYPALALFDDFPHVGASAGISGLLAYYAVRFPNRRLHVMLSFRLLLRSGRPHLVPAWLYFVLWGAMQILGAVTPDVSSSTGDSWLAAALPSRSAREPASSAIWHPAS